MLGKIKAWSERLRQDTYALYLAGRDPRVPLLAKVMVGIVAAYALSPIDLIPDFIPILGYLDDLLLLPLGIALAVKLIPAGVWEDCRRRAQQELLEKPADRKAAAVIIVIWVLAILLILWWVLV